MLKTLALLLLLTPTLLGCASKETPPCLGSCPPPPQLPSVLTDKPVSSGPNSTQRIESSLEKFEQSLTNARH